MQTTILNDIRAFSAAVKKCFLQLKSHHADVIARKNKAVRILICVNGVLKHVNTPDSYLRERCANIVDSVRSLA